MRSSLLWLCRFLQIIENEQIYWDSVRFCFRSSHTTLLSPLTHHFLFTKMPVTISTDVTLAFLLYQSGVYISQENKFKCFKQVLWENRFFVKKNQTIVSFDKPCGEQRNSVYLWLWVNSLEKNYIGNSTFEGGESQFWQWNYKGVSQLLRWSVIFSKIYFSTLGQCQIASIWWIFQFLVWF